MTSQKTISYTQARASESFKKTKAGIFLRWVLAGHSRPDSNLRMHSALRSLGAPLAIRPRNVADFRAKWESINAPKTAPFIWVF